MTKHLYIRVPADKSISHRAIILNALSGGRAKVHNILLSQDVLATLDCVQRLGCAVDIEGTTATIRAISNLYSDIVLDCCNSGTTMRLMAGFLASVAGCNTRLIGDNSLSRRPMMRVAEPLRDRGADIVDTDGTAPLTIYGKSLQSLTYTMPIASAQVKSAILLSGLKARGDTIVHQPNFSRNHTELMMQAMRCDIVMDQLTIKLNPCKVHAKDINVPGDMSSAAFWMVLAIVRPGTIITLQDVCVNPTRIGILQVLDQIGANYLVHNKKKDIEDIADITVEYTPYLKPFVIGKSMIPYLIDELPILALLACYCDGTSTVHDAQELRVKETDRISAIVHNLIAIGADITETQYGFIVKPSRLHGNVTVDSRFDHRIAMTMEIANILLGNITVIDKRCIAVSYPNWNEDCAKFVGVYQ
ncbi:MAG: 3-phosphoshikimate 1-carboxyvinyltransferase [Clostridiales bacterium]|jgi:3-phosphoshikimate 1-carboxyvinyltransferase|nr:3-phosphoshikimate 1-carboxyvinyltransferase [Clostridiales bacterium]